MRERISFRRLYTKSADSPVGLKIGNSKFLHFSPTRGVPSADQLLELLDRGVEVVAALDLVRGERGLQVLLVLAELLDLGLERGLVDRVCRGGGRSGGGLELLGERARVVLVPLVVQLGLQRGTVVLLGADLVPEGVHHDGGTVGLDLHAGGVAVGGEQPLERVLHALVQRGAVPEVLHGRLVVELLRGSGLTGAQSTDRLTGRRLAADARALCGRVHGPVGELVEDAAVQLAGLDGREQPAHRVVGGGLLLVVLRRVDLVAVACQGVEAVYGLLLLIVASEHHHAFRLWPNWPRVMGIPMSFAK